ncbi:CBS domain-containing protein [Candidatus Bipolaricaulota bacterium]|nr:CBS domain-containing protein [Candidatus Bipolaricaulota bacterium]
MDGDEPASGAFQGITQNEIGRLVVTDSAGDVAGIITRTDVMNTIKVVTNLPRS